MTPESDKCVHNQCHYSLNSTIFPVLIDFSQTDRQVGRVGSETGRQTSKQARREHMQREEASVAVKDR